MIRPDPLHPHHPLGMFLQCTPLPLRSTDLATALPIPATELTENAKRRKVSTVSIENRSYSADYDSHSAGFGGRENDREQSFFVHCFTTGSPESGQAWRFENVKI